jgi:F-type H+-transporting ATPase subunit gamma
MESTQSLKSRLGSVKNIGQITKAMEVVSATKMRKAQTVALGSRPYAFAALHALAELLAHASENLLTQSKLLEKREVKNTLVVLVGADRGLAGAFNSQVMRAADEFFRNDLGASRNQVPTALPQYSLILVGKKLSAYGARSSHPVEMLYSDFGDYAEPSEILPLAEHITNGFFAGSWDRVVVVSTHFKSTLSQFAVTRDLLPLSLPFVRDLVQEIVPEYGKFSELRQELSSQIETKNTEYIFEPSPRDLFDSLLPHLLSMQILHLILEANASEHSARMVAMKNASENAGELQASLSLEYNKLRQALITKEMIEITSATESV